MAKTFEDIKSDVSVWWYGFKWNAKRKAESAVKWAEENKELALAMIPVGIVAIKGIGNTIRSIDRNYGRT